MARVEFLHARLIRNVARSSDFTSNEVSLEVELNVKKQKFITDGNYQCAGEKYFYKKKEILEIMTEIQ